MQIDFVETKDGGAFKIENPNEPASVKPLRPEELKTWTEESGEKFSLFDVRSDEELKLASLPFATMLDEDRDEDPLGTRQGREGRLHVPPRNAKPRGSRSLFGGGLSQRLQPRRRH